MLRRESDAMLRRSAAIAVGRIATEQDEASVDALFSAMTEDNDPVTRHFASISLAQLDQGKIRARLRARFPKSDLLDRPFVALALGICKDTASAEQLRKALEKSKDESQSSALCLALALMGDTESIPMLTANVESKSRPWLQSYSAIGLGLLGSRESIPLLAKRLDDSNESRIRMNLGVALGLLKAPEAAQYFRDTLKGDGSLYERSSAAMSLAVLRINAAMPELVDVYRNPKEKDMVRAFAVVALGVLADPAPIPKLARIAIDHNYSISVDPLDEVLSIL
jgi:HEAT repeat protein